MRKIASLFVALLLLAGCSSVPLTGRKQVLLVSDQEVLSSSLTQYNDYIKTAKKSTNANKSDFYQWLLPVALCGVFSGLDPREQLPEKAQQSG